MRFYSTILHPKVNLIMRRLKYISSSLSHKVNIQDVVVAVRCSSRRAKVVKGGKMPQFILRVEGSLNQLFGLFTDSSSPRFSFLFSALHLE